jgi:hypothetical protein
MDWDIFISYSRIDDGDGWVTKFRDDLDARLKLRNPGRTYRIFFDTSAITENASFGPLIKTALPKTHVLVPIVSPAYLVSTYCRAELEWFKTARRTRARYEKVVMLPVEVLYEPDELQGIQGHQFNDGEDEYEQADARYKALVKTVARRIIDAVAASEAQRQRVLLLAVGSREQERERLQADLIEGEVEVLPEGPLADGVMARQNELDALAAKADFALLLHGTRRDADIDRVFACLLEKWATSPAVRCLSSVPAGALDPDLQELLTRLRAAPKAFDYVISPEVALRETLRRLGDLKTRDNHTPTVYLAYQRAARAWADRAREAIRKRSTRIRVLDPFGDGDGSEVLLRTRGHRDSLGIAHGIVVPFGEPADTFLVSLMSDILKTFRPARVSDAERRQRVALFAGSAAARPPDTLLQHHPVLRPDGEAPYDWLERGQAVEFDDFLARVEAAAQ